MSARPRLVTLLVEVTRACDHACLHCYNHWRHPDWAGAGEETRPVDLEPLLAHVLDQVDCGHVTLTGGEPLLHPGLPGLVGSLRGRGAGVTLISNGHRLDADSVADLVRRGVGLFELPLLSHRREVHDELSGAAGAFDAVLAALAEIRWHGARAVTAFVATRRNLADLADALKLAFAFGASGVLLNRFNPGGRGVAHVDELLPSAAELAGALAVADAFSAAHGLPISCSVPVQPCLVDTGAYPHLGFGFCAAGTDRAYFTLAANGDVRPCNHSTTVLGNAWREPFAAIVAAERLAPFVAAAPASCSGCRLLPTCQGGCKAAAQVSSGSLEDEEPFLGRNLALRRRPA